MLWFSYLVFASQRSSTLCPGQRSITTSPLLTSAQPLPGPAYTTSPWFDLTGPGVLVPLWCPGASLVWIISRPKGLETDCLLLLPATIPGVQRQAAPGAADSSLTRQAATRDLLIPRNRLLLG